MGPIFASWGKIVKLLIQHVARGDIWTPNNGSLRCCWWDKESAIHMHDWFEIDRCDTFSQFGRY